MSLTKIKYHASQTTNLEPPAIIQKILLKLKADDYRVVKVTDSSVAFDDKNTLFISSTKAIRRLDNGIFEISASDNGTIVTLTHHLKILPYVLILSAIVLVLIFQGEYPGIVFFGVFFAIASIFQNIATNDAGKEMLSIIVKGEYP